MISEIFLIPNIMAPIIIIFSINIGGVIIAEASLSFLGFGLPIKVPSWGGMLSWEGRRFMEQAPGSGLLAGAFPDDCRLLPQHVRRRPQGPARPPDLRAVRAATAPQRNANEASSPG